MQSLCWTCQTKNCDWVDRLKPIDGSIALLKKVSEYKARDRYCIDLIYLQCPKYTGGKRQDYIENIAYVKDGCIYGEGNEVLSIKDGYQIAQVAKKRYWNTISLFNQNREWCVSELAEETGLHKSTVSGHVDKGMKDGLIEKGERRKVIYTQNGHKHAIWTQFYRKAEGVD